MDASVATSLTSSLVLNDGHTMPFFGLGTSSTTATPNERPIKEAVISALRSGYRLIDTAVRYGNEKEIGDALRETGVERSEVFIVSKVWNDQHGYDACKLEVEESLSRLGIDFIDLFLIHSPIGGKIIETYDCLLEFKAKGKIRSVGVSNFASHHLEGIKKAGRPLPAVNQIELHPFYHKDDIVRWCRENGVALMGYCPLAKARKIEDPGLCQIAKKYGQSPGLIMIRWSLQHGYITIPKASSAEHIEGNTKVFGWSIHEEDMAALDSFTPCRVSWDPTSEPWLE